MVIHTKKVLLSNIQKLGIKSDDTLLIHSSMKAIGEVDGGGDAVLDSFMDYLRDGLLVFPTHTWEQMNEHYNYFDYEKEPSCVGVLTNVFMKREVVCRSLHPTHSVAAFGGNATEFVSGEEFSHTPCPRNGCWGKLYDMDAKILFIGCTLKSNTLIHGVEEWCKIPNRLTQNTHKYLIKGRDGSVMESRFYRHDSPHGDVSKNYGKLKTPLVKSGIAKKGTYGNAEVTVCQAKPMVELTKRFLARNPDLFADDRLVPQDWY